MMGISRGSNNYFTDCKKVHKSGHWSMWRVSNIIKGFNGHCSVPLVLTSTNIWFVLMCNHKFLVQIQYWQQQFYSQHWHSSQYGNSDLWLGKLAQDLWTETQYGWLKLDNKPCSLFVRLFAEGDKPLPKDTVISSEEGERSVSASQRKVPFHCSADGRHPPRLTTCGGRRSCTSGVHVSGKTTFSILFTLVFWNIVKAGNVHRVFAVDLFAFTIFNMQCCQLRILKILNMFFWVRKPDNKPASVKQAALCPDFLSWISLLTLVCSRVYCTLLLLQYVYFRMGCRQAEMVKTKLFTLTLEELRCRHSFLERRGLFQTPDKKGQTLVLNPRLKDFLSISQELYLTDVANATQEEFDVFQKLVAREQEEEEQGEEYSSDDYDDDDNEITKRSFSYKKKNQRAKKPERN